MLRAESKATLVSPCICRCDVTGKQKTLPWYFDIHIFVKGAQCFILIKIFNQYFSIRDKRPVS